MLGLGAMTIWLALLSVSNFVTRVCSFASRSCVATSACSWAGLLGVVAGKFNLRSIASASPRLPVAMTVLPVQLTPMPVSHGSVAQIMRVS